MKKFNLLLSLLFVTAFSFIANAQPPNDLICNATTIICNETVYSTTTDATFTNESGLPVCGGPTGTSPGVWYKFNAPAVVTRIDIVARSVVTVFPCFIHVYSSSDGTCTGLLTCIAGNTTPIQGLGGPDVCFYSYPGKVYFIYVNGQGTSFGTFGMAPYCSTPLPTVTVSSNVTICTGSSTTLTAAGATTYSWSPATGLSATTGATVTANPTVTTTYTVTATDLNGCTNSPTVTVTVNSPPVITCPANISVCINAPPFALSGGSPTGGIYAGVGVSAGMFDAGAAGGVGPKTITFSYTDPVTGCTNSCTYTITVYALPVITCPANIEVCIDTAPFALSGGSPTGGIYTGVGVNNGTFNPAGAGGPGVKTITYTYTSALTGCTSSCTFTIKVNALPVDNGGNPYPTQFLAGPAINLIGPPFTPPVPAGGTFSAPLSPPSTVVGNMFNPASAGVGVHTITYTDPNGCIKIFTITVISNPCPTSIIISPPGPCPFCSNLTLTAIPDQLGAYNYEWRRGVGGPVVGTQQTLDLTLADPDGIYIVTIPGCPGVSASFTYLKQNWIGSYTILATNKNVNLGQFNFVKGSVGSTHPTGQVKIGSQSKVFSPGFVKAQNLNIHSAAIVPIRYPGSPVVVTSPLPCFQYNNTTPTGPDLTVTSNNTYAGNYRNVIVKKNVVVTFTTGTIFKKLTLEEGAKATLNQPVVNFEEIEMMNGKNVGFGNRTRLNFAGNTVVRVKDKVDVGDYCRINEGGHKVTFFVQFGKFRVRGRGTKVVANVYALNDNVEVTRGTLANQIYMTGRFIAKEVISDHYVNWNGYDCRFDNSIPPRITKTNPTMEALDLQVNVFPNPSETSFNLTTVTSSKEMMDITMYNLIGLKVQQMKAMPGQTLRLGDHVVSGTYLIEVRQGNERVTLKVVKQ